MRTMKHMRHAAVALGLVLSGQIASAQEPPVDLSGIWWTGAPVPLLPGPVAVSSVRSLVPRICAQPIAATVTHATPPILHRHEAILESYHRQAGHARHGRIRPVSTLVPR